MIENFNIIFPLDFKTQVKGLKDLIKEFDRQFENGSISVNGYNEYIKVCNDNLIKLHEIVIPSIEFIKGDE